MSWPRGPGPRPAPCGTTSRAGCCPARRDGNGHRTYDEADLRLLAQIRTLQDFGFELEETRPFVECLRAGHPEGDSCPASLQVYRRKLAELDALIGQLRSVRGTVAGQLARAEEARDALAADALVPGGPEPGCELGGQQR